jgi:MFS family permease
MIAFGVFNGLWRTWWSLYLLEELGASIQIVGILGMIQSSSSILFQLPGGILADRIGRRWIIALGTSLRIVAPISFLFASSWEWVIPGIMANAAAAVYMPGFTALIVESLPYEKRATGYGIYRMLTSIPSIFMPIVSGIYFDSVGLVSGMRTALTISIFAFTGAFLIRFFFLKETLNKESHTTQATTKTSKQDIVSPSLRDTFSNLPQLLGGTVLAMQVISIISGFGIRMVWSYMSVYGVEVMDLTKTEWGLLQTVASACGTPLYLVGGLIADKYGRVPSITFARFLLPIRQLGILFLRDYNQLLLLFALIGIGGGLGGGGVRGGGFMGGPAWQSLIADLVPSKDRGKLMGLMGTITGLTNLPAPPLGGYVWENYGPNTLMMISIVIGFAPIPLIRLFVKEPKTRER